MSVCIPMADDMHMHLRQGDMMSAVVPGVQKGGCVRGVVMPNTSPPVKTCEEAGRYRQQLLNIDANVDYLMTLYLGEWIMEEDLREHAKANRVTGVKSYPKGVTTNSEIGIESYEKFYPVFRVMEREGITLHLHGEAPGVDFLTAEQAFLPHLHSLALAFPHLRIVLEHVSSKEAVEAVASHGNVAATVTAHHLDLTTQDVMADATSVAFPHNFCKPLAKTCEDRNAIREVVRSGHHRFFLGSDSAPHPRNAKTSNSPCAGVFTAPYLMSYVADSFSRLDCLPKLEAFACQFGAEFFGLPPNVVGDEWLEISPKPFQVPMTFGDGVLPTETLVVPYRAGETLVMTAEKQCVQ